jgi:excinuclease UvrABC ATPase subunit
MEKIGWTVINRRRNGGKPVKCVNCGGEGVMRVTFNDPWCKLTITLCDKCSKKRYEDLDLQRNLKFPGIG